MSSFSNHECFIITQQCIQNLRANRSWMRRQSLRRGENDGENEISSSPRESQSQPGEMKTSMKNSSSDVDDSGLNWTSTHPSSWLDLMTIRWKSQLSQFLNLYAYISPNKTHALSPVHTRHILTSKIHPSGIIPVACMFMDKNRLYLCMTAYHQCIPSFDGGYFNLVPNFPWW